MSLKRRIAIIIPSMGGGGAERVLINLLTLIQKEEISIDLYVGIKGGRLIQHVPSWVNVKTIFPNLFVEKLALVLYRKYNYNFFLKLYGQKIQGNYTTAISFLDSTYSEFLFFNKAKIDKKALVIHSSYKTYSNRFKFVESMYDRLQLRYNSVNTIISVSNEAMMEFKELFGEKKDMRVIYNPLNTEEILGKSLEEIPNLPAGVVNIVAIGSLLEVKGYDRLIRACEGIDKNLFHLTILGEGPLRPKLISIVNELKLKDNVSLIGFKANPYPWLLKSDFFIMTSVAEGLPTVLCEAIILEKPVMVTNVPGCREVIDYGKYGLMVEGDVDSIREGLERMIADEPFRNYYKGKSKERRNIFDDNKALNSYMEVFLNS